MRIAPCSQLVVPRCSICDVRKTERSLVEIHASSKPAVGHDLDARRHARTVVHLVALGPFATLTETGCAGGARLHVQHLLMPPLAKWWRTSVQMIASHRQATASPSTQVINSDCSALDVSVRSDSPHAYRKAVNNSACCDPQCCNRGWHRTNNLRSSILSTKSDDAETVEKQP